MSNVYVLRCNSGKWYVGRSDNVERRFEEHKKGNGSTWTDIYRPIAIEKVYSNVSPFEEDKVVKEMMSKHGIHNVRGGTYSSMRLGIDQFELLHQEIQSARNVCWNCGRPGHFASACRVERGESDSELEDASDSDFEEDESEEEYTRPPLRGNTCWNCGRPGHFASSCWFR